MWYRTHCANSAGQCSNVNRPVKPSGRRHGLGGGTSSLACPNRSSHPFIHIGCMALYITHHTHTDTGTDLVRFTCGTALAAAVALSCLLLVLVFLRLARFDWLSAEIRKTLKLQTWNICVVLCVCAWWICSSALKYVWHLSYSIQHTHTHTQRDTRQGTRYHSETCNK